MTITSLYSTAASIRAMKNEGVSIMEGRRPRYHLRVGGLYLHFSGLMLTDKRAWAWTGSIEQGRKCRRSFDAAAGCRLHLIKPLPVHEEVEA